MRLVLSLPLWLAWLALMPLVLLFAAVVVVARPHDAGREYGS
jgi:hypothetical protein